MSNSVGFPLVVALPCTARTPGSLLELLFDNACGLIMHAEAEEREQNGICFSERCTPQPTAAC